MKPTERDKARQLRADEGMSIKGIAALLSVSSSSVSRWVRDIELTPEQIARLREASKGYARFHDSWVLGARAARQKRLRSQEEGRRRVREGDQDFILACALYWGEGGKHRSTLTFTNSDVAMVSLFAGLLRTTMAVDIGRIRLAIHSYDAPLGSDAPSKAEIERHWFKALGFKRAQLRSHVRNAVSRSSKRKRGHTLPYGTAHIPLDDVQVVQTLFGGISQLSGSAKAR